MTKNNTLRLILLVLCLATIIVSVSSCDKQIDKPAAEGPKAQLPAKGPDYYFSRVRFFKDGRTPSTDTTWTLHLITVPMVEQYRKSDGYIYNETSTFTEVGSLWSK